MTAYVFRSRTGTSWTSQWVGDNSGRYEWRSDNARLLVYRDGSRYYAKIDGRSLPGSEPTLRAAMDTATQIASRRDAA